jgi:hypothetical protein
VKSKSQVLGQRRALLNNGREQIMFLILAIIVGVAWLLGFVVFHVASSAIHLLLVLAIVGIIVHFVRGSRTGGHATFR